jgi:alpha-L-fucosidase
MKYQPKAVVFQGPSPNAIRWIGNEDGVAPYPCWSGVSEAQPDSPEGDPDGSIWRPGECDVPIRRGEWGWKPDQEDRVESVDHLMDLYCKSVGRNANLLLNSNPNRDGLIPEPDFTRYAEFGAEINRRFGKAVAETHGKGDKVTLDLPGPTTVDHVIASEDITEGQRVRRYALEGLIGGSWEKIAEGSSIGHKRIESFPPAEVTKIRLNCEDAVSMPIIKRLATFRVKH